MSDRNFNDGDGATIETLDFGRRPGVRRKWLSFTRGFPRAGARQLVASIYFEDGSAELTAFGRMIARTVVRDGLSTGVTEIELHAYPSNLEPDGAELAEERFEAIRDAVMDVVTTAGTIDLLDLWRPSVRWNHGEAATRAPHRRIDLFMTTPAESGAAAVLAEAG